jgi:hypothetical protein
VLPSKSPAKCWFNRAKLLIVECVAGRFVTVIVCAAELADPPAVESCAVTVSVVAG